MTRLKSITICLVFFLTLLSGNIFAQVLVQNDKFTYAPLFNNQVVLVREIPLNNNDIEKSFHRVKEWGKERYASSPLISNIRYDNTNKEIIIKSRIELLLPENNDKIREKVVMTYHLNTFIFNDKCVFEVKGITYKLHNVKKSVKAEDIITPSALETAGPQQELRVNIQRSTLFFLNELADSLADALNAPDSL
ncbi:DUF4468 domain-containing protein [Dysgonomonas sp. HGC4]|uniref:DUF4468 domain-containing protein n=1 Tax=Dysgonomonas sp. HGC4 TaxID=1658009 RepID=UPI0006823F0D|nr:DUF4468 domain-containing protein [Dysgonomonas sp. HGC4]MBD8348625.1 DUF4468 domain-containing protein [Dysgonomonas sp. HGC4]